jgi:mycoredoxin
MLNVYATRWCPHCRKTIDYLEKNGIEFNYLDMEAQPPDVTQTIIDVNGGNDWVVPTLEFNGKWREGRFFNAEKLHQDLVKMGVIE